MLRKIKLILQVLLLQLTARSQAIPFDQLPFTNPLITDIDSSLHQQVKVFFKKAKAPGIIIGISQNGDKSFYSYGYADSASKKQFTEETIFEIGSITKTFTANLLLQLQEKNLLDIQNPVIDYLPGHFNNDSVLKKISLANIASHTSGLPRLPSDLDKIKEYTLMQPYEFYNKEHLYSYLKTINKINTGKYAYSNLGFGVLATIEEEVSGMRFGMLLDINIFQPLQMKNTYVDVKNNNADSATGYFYGKPAAYWKFGSMAGAGAIKSTTADLLKYLEAHIENSNKHFSTAVARITQPIKPITTNMQICYGWHTLDDLKYRVFWHNGGTYGFSTFAAFEPQSKICIVLAANSTGDNAALDKMAVDLLILLMGK